MLGGGGDRFSVYALGGYSRFDVGTDVPYNYATNGYHGGGGLRLGLSDRLAIRFDGRAVFGQEDNIAGGSAMHLVGSLGLAYFTGSRRASERDEPEPPAPIEDVPSPQQPPMAEGREPDEPAMPEAGRREPPPPPRAARLRGPSGRAEQIELGLFGSFTRYDRSFELENQIGAGVRLGYFLSDRVNIEVEGGFQTPKQKAPGTESSTFALGSASLGFNFPAGRHSFYLLGGYTHQQFADFPPYEFSDHSVHGAVGARFFLSRRVALRLEGRAIYGWDTNSGTAPWSGQVIGSAGLSFFATPPRQRTAGGVGGRSYQWYWGGQGGAIISRTNLQPYYYDPLVGGHWMISAKRTSLYVAYEQAFFISDSRAAIFDPSAEFTGARRSARCTWAPPRTGC
jgi:hypothetical protein